jgi:hypothetical protein
MKDEGQMPASARRGGDQVESRSEELMRDGFH